VLLAGRCIRIPCHLSGSVDRLPLLRRTARRRARSWP
jgi:hypothetical protein